MIESILLELQKIFQSNLDYFKKQSIIISEIESDIEKIAVSMFPAMVIMPGGERMISNDNANIKTFQRDVEIIYANHYLKSDTILFGDLKNKGIIKIENDIKKIISDNPTLNNMTDELVSYDLSVGILPNLEHFTIARKVLLTYKFVEVFRSF